MRKARTFLLFLLLIALVCVFIVYTHELKITRKYDAYRYSTSYNEFARAVGDFEKTYFFKNLDEADAAYQEIYHCHPEIFWLDDEYTYDEVTGGVEVTIKYNCGSVMAKVYDILFNIKTSFLERKLKKCESEYDKVKLVHDYLCENATYNAYNKFAHTGMGCVVIGDTVCQGYADAARIILNKAGVKCGIIWGNAGGESHAWNWVEIDGDNYAMDITWDDKPSTSGKEAYTYEYFLLSTEEMFQNGHRIASDCAAPKCNHYYGETK
jgi:transglutaminase/protease-like cytokinesis protein 3